MISIKRGLKALPKFAVEILIALYLLNHSVKWFLGFWFLHYIYWNSIMFDAVRSRDRVFQVANEIKLIAIMNKLGISTHDTAEVFEEQKKEWTERNVKTFEEDFKLVFE